MGRWDWKKMPRSRLRTARVLKMVPNVRLMLIYFDDREGIFRCIKEAEDNHPPKSECICQKGRGDDDLYRMSLNSRTSGLI